MNYRVFLRSVAERFLSASTIERVKPIASRVSISLNSLGALSLTPDPTDRYLYHFVLRRQVKVTKVWFEMRWQDVSIPAYFDQDGKKLRIWLDPKDLSEVLLATHRFDLVVETAAKGVGFNQKHTVRLLGELGPHHRRYFPTFELQKGKTHKGRIYVADDSRVRLLVRDPFMTDMSERGILASGWVTTVALNRRQVTLGIKIKLTYPQEITKVIGVELLRTGSEDEKLLSSTISQVQVSGEEFTAQAVFDLDELGRIAPNGHYRIAALVVCSDQSFWVSIDRLTETAYDWFNRRFRRVIRCGDKALFPQLTANNRFFFSIEPPDESDSLRVRLAEAFATWLHDHGHSVKNRPVLLFEKYASSAQDNSFFLFQWVMENIPQNNAFYVIDRNCPQAKVVRPYKNHVLWLYSLKYFRHLLAAQMLVAADTPRHAYNIERRFGRVIFSLLSKPMFFLQHGVTALKKLSARFRSKTSGIDYFLVTTGAEQQILKDFGEYRDDQVPLLGFPRWDRLSKDGAGNSKDVLYFPTWRKSLNQSTDEEFTTSRYFLGIEKLLKSPELHATLAKHGLRMKVCLHPYMEHFVNHLTADSAAEIDILSTADVSVADLITESAMVVSDYSSVVWDFAYQRKPVVFYQFDQRSYQHEFGSYLDLNHIPIGSTWNTVSETVADIDRYAQAGFQLDSHQLAVTKRTFPYTSGISASVWDFVGSVLPKVKSHPYLSSKELEALAIERWEIRAEAIADDLLQAGINVPTRPQV